MTEVLGKPLQKPTCKLGTIMKGVDGQLWKINKVNGKKEWVELTKYRIIDYKSDDNNRSIEDCITKSYVSIENLTEKTYFTHDGKKRPFKVDIKQNEINVYANEDIYDVLVLTVTGFLGYWKGNQYEYIKEEHKDNSIFIQLDAHNYVYICDNIQLFKTDDVIYDYDCVVYSPNEINAAAFGGDNTYFLDDMYYLRNDQIPKQVPIEQTCQYFYGVLAIPKDPLLKGKKKSAAPSDFGIQMLQVETLQEKIS